jgi:hypothetical protein
MTPGRPADYRHYRIFNPMRTTTRLLLILTVMIGTLTVHAQNQNISLLAGKVTLSVPKKLQPISDEHWQLKYPGKTKPMLTLSDDNAEINLIAMATQQPAQDSQLIEFINYQFQQVKTKRPESELIDKGVTTVNGKKMAYMKFISSAIDQKVFNYFFFVLVDGKIVMFTFNCAQALQKTWEPKAAQIVESLKIK